ASDHLGHHLDRAARALLGADPAPLAEGVVERGAAPGRLAIPRLQLADRVVRADAEAVVAVEAVAAGKATARLVERGRLVEPLDDLLERRAPPRQLERLLHRARRVRVVPRVELAEPRKTVLRGRLRRAVEQPAVDVPRGLLPVALGA